MVKNKHNQFQLKFRCAYEKQKRAKKELSIICAFVNTAFTKKFILHKISYGRKVFKTKPGC